MFAFVGGILKAPANLPSIFFVPVFETKYSIASLQSISD